MAEDSLIPKPAAPKLKIGGLSRQAQKMQAAREKAEGKAAGKHTSAGAAPKAKPLAGAKKVSFQRKAV